MNAVAVNATVVNTVVVNTVTPGQPRGWRYAAGVEQFYTALMVLVVVAVAWFACYVVYRLFSDHR